MEIIFFAIIAGINFNSLENASDTLINEKVTATSQLLVELLKTPLIVSDLATVDDIVKNFSKLENAVAIQIEDINHNIISANIKKDTITRDIFESSVKKSHNLSKSYLVGDNLFTNVDVTIDNKKIAHIHFVFNSSKIIANIQENKNLTYIMIIIALIAGLIISYIVGSQLGKSLEKLTEIAKDIANDIKVSIPYKSKNRDEMGELFYNMHLMQDIIKERTNNLYRSLNNLKQFIKALNESAIVSKTDISGTITYVNDKFCEVSGYSEDELLGNNHRILRDPDTKNSFFKHMWDTIKSKKVYHATVRNIKKGGQPYYVDATIVPLLDEDGNITEYLAIRYEVTELVAAKNKALEAKKIKDEFLSNMSHEIRTPINAILGFVKILEKNTTDEKNIEYLKIISSSSHLLLHIINDILDLSKIENDKLIIDAHPINPRTELMKVVDLFSMMGKEKSISIKSSIDEATPECLEGDLLRIKQIVFNFLSNALKFTPNNKNIFIDTKYKEGVLYISVKDEGIGMSEDAKNKIFNAFEQADNSTTRKFGGTGLGLAISLKLAKLMNGDITIDSQENNGSTFTLSIPLKTCTEELKEIATSTDEDQDKKYNGNILVAEDNKTNQMLLKVILEDYHITYTIANDGVEAVDMFKDSKFDLVLMDENMPNMTGSEAFKKIREYEKKNNLKETPVIALTANVMQKDVNKFKKLGMNDFLAKPIDTDQLEKVLDTFLTRA